MRLHSAHVCADSECTAEVLARLDKIKKKAMEKFPEDGNERMRYIYNEMAITFTARELWAIALTNQ